MKYLFSLLLVLTGLLTSSHSVAQGSLAALDAKNGFKGYAFGSALSKYKDLSHSPSVSEYDESFSKSYDYYIDKLECYGSNKSNNKIGDLVISTPFLFFFHNKLTRIDFFANNPDGRELVTLYKSLYGIPKVTYGESNLGTKITIYSWKGNKVSLNVTYCAKPYQGSTTISGLDTTVSPWYRIVYLSKPMLAEIQNSDPNRRKLSNNARAKDL